MSCEHDTTNYRWVILTLFFFIQTTASMVVFAFGPLAPYLQENLHITRAQVGMFPSAIYLGMMAFSTHAGWFTDKYGIRLFLVAGPASMGLLLIAFAFSRFFLLSLVIIFVAGVGYQFINPTTIKGLLLWFPPKLRGTAIGLKQAGVSFGGAIIAMILPILILSVGWKGSVIFLGIFTIISALIIAFFYHEPPSEATLKVKSSGIELRGIFHILKNRDFLLLGGCGVNYGISATAFHTYLILYLVENLYISIVLSGFLLATSQLGVIAGRILWGIISDRFFGGRRKVPIFMIGFSIFIMAVITVLVLPFAPYWLMHIILAVFGFSLGYNGIYLTFMSELGQEMAATGVGFGAAIAASGIVFGTPIFGYIADKTASYNSAWMYMALMGIIGSIMASFIREEKRI